MNIGHKEVKQNKDAQDRYSADLLCIENPFHLLDWLLTWDINAANAENKAALLAAQIYESIIIDRNHQYLAIPNEDFLGFLTSEGNNLKGWLKENDATFLSMYTGINYTNAPNDVAANKFAEVGNPAIAGFVYLLHRIRTYLDEIKVISDEALGAEIETLARKKVEGDKFEAVLRNGLDTLPKAVRDNIIATLPDQVSDEVKQYTIAEQIATLTHLYKRRGRFIQQNVQYRCSAYDMLTETYKPMLYEFAINANLLLHKERYTQISGYQLRYNQDEGLLYVFLKEEN